MKSKDVKRRDLRVLFSSNGVHTNSGYGVFSRDFLYRLLKDGWPVAHVAFWGITGYPVEIDGEYFDKDLGRGKDVWKGLKLYCYPQMGDPFGLDAAINHAVDYKANVVMTMQDVPLLDPNQLKSLNFWVPYVPIDKDPCPPPVIERLRFAYRIVTFSKFGQRVLEDAGFTSTLILEGTDTDIFKPMDQVECRKGFGLPQDAFMFSMVAANKENPPRKGFQEALEAFKLFHDNHPEAAIFFHTQQMSPTGFPIKPFAEYLKIQDRMFFLNDYTSVYKANSALVAKEMNACDVQLHPSQTEGFGLTIVEAQSCGKPVLVTDYTSMPELIVEGETGFATKTAARRYTNDGSFTHTADVKSLYDNMEKVYRLVKDKPKETVKACRQNVLDNYDIDVLVEKQWVPFLESLQEDILKPVVAPTT